MEIHKRKLIFFKNGIETLGFFSIQLAKAFEEMGHEVFLFDLLEEKRDYKRLLSFLEYGNTTLISFNFTGFRGEDIFLEKDGTLLWDQKKILCLNILVDHPFYYPQLLKHPPLLYRQICIDRYHENYMHTYFPWIQTEPFLPLGGTGLSGFPPLEGRENAVLFTGNYTPPTAFDKYITRLDDDYTTFYHSIIDTLISNPSLPMEIAFTDALYRELGNLSKEALKACMENMIFIDLYVRFYFRGLVIKTLVDNGIQVHVFGSGWEKLDCIHKENLILGGAVNSHACLLEMQKAKISLNIMPWFKDGAHDRIFNSMLNGALCLTDSSIFLEQEFVDNQDLCFFSLLDITSLPQKIINLLENPASMNTIIQTGYQKAKLHHTWKERAKIITDYIA
ncbi:MAG: glycosyltransferase [Acetivibrio sp.]